MKHLWIDIGISLVLATGILIWQQQPLPDFSLNLTDNKKISIDIQKPAIVLFWDREIKSSHRDIQLIQRFTQAHPDITVYYAHQPSIPELEIQGFLVDLGVYTTPVFNKDWPSQIPTTILLTDQEQLTPNHSPHYTELMEFFQREF